MRAVPAQSSEPRFALVGARGDERVALFQQALARRRAPAAALVDYRDLLAAPESLSAALRDAAYLRIESPGTDFEVWRALASQAGVEEDMGAPSARALQGEQGRLHPPRLLFSGLCRALALAKPRIAASPVLSLNDPDAIALFFDKRACHQRLQAAVLPVPPCLAPPRSFDELVAAMRAARMSRVFAKLRHGSAASGVVALEMSRQNIQAWSSTELVVSAGETRLYNSYRVRRYRGAAEVGALIDALAQHELHVERWFPKAGVAGRCCDLRLLMIAGEPAHAVLRLGHSPITNLHLRNERAGADLLRAKLPPATWEAMIDAARRVAALFPRSFHVALDLAVHVDLKRFAILELNAFGDHLRRVQHDGLDPYELQLERLPAWAAARRDGLPPTSVQHAAA